MTRIAYIGHSTVKIESEAATVLTDPVLCARVGHLRRIVPVPDVPRLGARDVVLLSHGHLDHLHGPSLRRLGREPMVVAPRGLGRLAERAGFRRVREVEAGERVELDGLALLATPAEHEGRRWPVGRSSEALGYVIAGSRHRIYFAGDTDLFEGMRNIDGDLDLALLPIAGWGPRLPPGHLTPATAASAAALLRPRAVVPIHWGTYSSRSGRTGDPEEPVREFTGNMEARAPEVRVRALLPGESLTLD